MKRFSRIFRVISAALVMLVAFVFTVLESTLFVTLDFLLYENELVAAIQLLFKLSVSIGAFAIGLLAIVKKSRSFFAEGSCILLSSVVMTPFVCNNFGWYFIAVSAVFLVSDFVWLKSAGVGGYKSREAAPGSENDISLK